MTPLRCAEVRVAASVLGESIAIDLYGEAAVRLALGSREGRSTKAVWDALRAVSGASEGRVA